MFCPEIMSNKEKIRESFDEDENKGSREDRSPGVRGGGQRAFKQRS